MNTSHFNTTHRDGVISGAGRAREASRNGDCTVCGTEVVFSDGSEIVCPNGCDYEPEDPTRDAVRRAFAGYPDRMRYRPASREPRRKPSTEPLPPINRVLFALTDAGCDWRPALRDADSWQANCPTHQDTRPSLQVTRNADGSIWLKCWAGCSKEGILAALGLEWRDLWDGARFDAGRRDGLNVRPLLPAHLRRAMEDLIRTDDERRAA